ncbi:MAG: PfaD family polyunsaturated fatty acid/polyketide biosynthesis protein [Hyphomicrobiales bacterium]|nr:PfaD family polyunsaturated fatty acid/polyketide biosynthesis protein [Hyphomicrobiales bacterium]
MSEQAITALVNGSNHVAGGRAAGTVIGGLGRAGANGNGSTAVVQVVGREAGEAPAAEGSHQADNNVLDVRVPVAVYASSAGRHAVGLVHQTSPELSRSVPGGGDGGSSLVAVLPPIYPEWLGTRRFTTHHNCRFPYVVGAMAKGITTAPMVSEAASHGLMGFFGAAGLRPPVVADAINEIRANITGDAPWGSNLIHSPNRPEREREMVDLYLEQSVARVSASAFMDLSPEIVRYSAHGLTVVSSGNVDRTTHVFAKISRPEVAGKFMAPPSADLLRELAAAGRISSQQAELQSKLPISEDVTVEADSGGHTDNRPLPALFPIIASLRNRLVDTHRYERPIRLGAAGGLGTPQAVAAAFQLGADYVLTGSVNQAAIESGLSDEGRALLAGCDFSDVMMAPAADMFERGGKVQVLKKGTMFPIKAQRLYEIYRRNAGFEAVPVKERAWLEGQVFMETCEEAWAQTRAYHATSNPPLAVKADGDPKLQMALTFRRYLFMAARWACEGRDDRSADYQIWCGPAMGSFNAWARNSFLEEPENRTVGQIALNLLEGACVATRVQQLRLSGIDVADHHHAFAPTRITLGWTKGLRQ